MSVSLHTIHSLGNITQICVEVDQVSMCVLYDIYVFECGSVPEVYDRYLRQVILQPIKHLTIISEVQDIIIYLFYLFVNFSKYMQVSAHLT